jgi:putative glutamine amidotransferase
LIGCDRPVIGVTTSARSGWRIFPLIALSLWAAGARAKWFRVGRPADVATVDGLIVGGGDDISADLYDGAILPEARIDPARDALERRLIDDATMLGRPILGICRGAQMLNIARGGALHQNIYDTYEGARRLWTVLPAKTVTIAPGSRLSSIMGGEPARVNALHTQSISRLGVGLSISATDEYGIVQAVEGKGGFALGVQWHPEHLFYAHRQRAIFRALVGAARAARDGAGPRESLAPHVSALGLKSE